MAVDLDYDNILRLLMIMLGAVIAYGVLEFGSRYLKKDQETSEDPGYWELEEEWDTVYRDYKPEAIPWEAREPDPGLVDLLDSGRIEGGRALDMGFGLGTHSIYLAEKGFQVSGIDKSHVAVEKATRRATLEGLDCSFILGDASDLPYPEESFSFIFDRGCFHHIPEERRDRYANGVQRVLKEGGHYYLICFSYKNGPAWNHFTPRQIKEYFSPYFEILEIKDETFKEPSTGHVLHFLKVLMRKG